MSKLTGADGGGGTLLPPPTRHLYALVPAPALSPAACLLATDGDRGWKTHSDSQQRSDFPLGMSQGFGHKSRRIHIYQTGARFCPAEKEDPEWAHQQTSPSWGALSGAAKRLSQRPFECCPPATSHARLRAQKRSRARTHTPPCPRHSPAWRRTMPPDHIKRKAPQLLLKSNGFAPKDGSSKVAAPGAPWQRTFPPVDERQIENIPNIKCSCVPGKLGLRLLELGVRGKGGKSE